MNPTWNLSALALAIALCGWTSTGAAQRRIERPQIPRNLRSAPDMWIATTTGADAFRIREIVGNFKLAAEFQLTAFASPTNASVDASQLIGQPVTLGVRQERARFQTFNGIVSSVSTSGTSGTSEVQIVVHPWTRLLHRVANNMMLENTTAPDALRAVLDRYSFAEYEVRLRRTYPVEELVVQYRETDWNFIQRMVEHIGAYYFFEHTALGHRLVITDTPNSFPRRARRRSPAIPVFAYGDENLGVDRCSDERDLVSSGYSLSDTDPARPGELIIGNAQPAPAGPFGPLVMHDHPGGYTTPEAARFYAQTRLEELRVRDRTMSCITASPFARIGFTFRMTGHPRPSQDGEFLVTRLSMTFGSRGGGSGVSRFAQMHAIPAGTAYRPSRRAAWPIINGSHLGVVVGRRPGQVETDARGRVRVRFPFRVVGGAAAQAWVRATPAADGRPPRVGAQVLISYREGEPQRPVVSGLLGAPTSAPTP